MCNECLRLWCFVCSDSEVFFLVSTCLSLVSYSSNTEFSSLPVSGLSQAVPALWSSQSLCNLTLKLLSLREVSKIGGINTLFVKLIVKLHITTKNSFCKFSLILCGVWWICFNFLSMMLPNSPPMKSDFQPSLHWVLYWKFQYVIHCPRIITTMHQHKHPPLGPLMRHLF